MGRWCESNQERLGFTIVIGDIMYRLHIDIPLNMSEEEAILMSHSIIAMFKTTLQINYRLGHDEDRQRSNYLIKDEKGHVSNKKCILGLTSDDSVV